MESAWLRLAIANISSGAARAPTNVVVFTKVTPVFESNSRQEIVNHSGENPRVAEALRVLQRSRPSYGAALSGSNVVTFIKKRVYWWADVDSNSEPCALTREFSMMFSGNSDTPMSCMSVADMHW